MNELLAEKIEKLQNNALSMRKKALYLAYNSGLSAHLGGGLSIIDVLAVLYGDIMNTCDKSLSYSLKDKFILSKGHGVLGLYTALNEFGIISNEILDTYMKDNSDLIAHPVLKPELGLEASSGSLGQGISLAVGLALAAKKKNYSYKVYTICGNGECNEGSVWEACMFAVSYKLDNFTLYIDNNNMQSDGDSESVLGVSKKYSEMLNALGFNVISINGNDIGELLNAYQCQQIVGVPKAIIGNSIKGKGISFMENNPEWHHNRLTKEQYEIALSELM